MLLAFVTIVCVWLGFVANRAHRQKRLIALLGGKDVAQRYLVYDYEVERTRRGRDNKEPDSPTGRWPKWLVDALGDDWFVTVVLVELPPPKVVNTDAIVDAVCDVSTLKYIRFGKNTLSQSQANRIVGVHGGTATLDAWTRMDD